MEDEKCHNLMSWLNVDNYAVSVTFKNKGKRETITLGMSSPIRTKFDGRNAAHTATADVTERFVSLRAIFQIGDSNSTQTRASRCEIMLEECLTELCSSFKSVFKHVSQPFLTGVDSQVSSTDGKNVILT